MKNSIALALTLLCGFAWSQSQPPAPGGAKSGEPKEAHTPKSVEKSSDKTEATDKAPLEVDGVFTAQKTQSSGEQEAKKSHEESAWKGVWEAIIAIGTVFLAVLTGVLAYFTFGLWKEAQSASEANQKAMRESIDAATNAANAARDSVDTARDEFIAAHRPEIRVRHVWPVGEIWSGEKIAVAIEIVNVGITTAKITEYSATTLLIRANQTLPSPPSYGYKIVVRRDPFLVSGQSTRLPPADEGMRAFTDAENVAIREGREMLYCFGYVRYDDDKGRARQTAFVRVLAPPGTGVLGVNGRFNAHQDSDYEYQD